MKIKINKFSVQNIFINGVYDVETAHGMKKCMILKRIKDKFIALLSKEIIKHIENKNTTSDSIKKVFDEKVNINIAQIDIKDIYKLHFVVDEDIHNAIKEAID